jgi:hypothetical protein
MKKLIVILMPIILVACGPNKNELKLMSESDSLQQAIVGKDSAIYAFLNTFNAIEGNLQAIKEKENLVSMNAAKPESNMSREEQINNDIQAIYDMMLENRAKLSRLEQQLKLANNKNKDLQTAIEVLTNRLAEKDAEIANLLNELAALNIKVAALNYSVDTLTKINEEKSATIAAQSESLNTAYYIVATDKELKELKIFDKKGGLIGGKKLNHNFDKSLFKKIDIIKTRAIEINAQKIKIITTHPQSAYIFEGEKPINRIIITNPEEFWSVSKYLIVSIEK